MAEIVWDDTGEKIYETGVDHGVLYKPNAQGEYEDGVAWNGLTTVTESPSGAESNKQYADNIVYLNLLSAEEFGATIEAFTYPDEFAEHDGSGVPAPGLSVGQQSRKPFGLAYRTKVGNDTEGVDFGYKYHLIYGALAAPSEKAYATINDSPEAIAFSWELSTTPVNVGDVNGQEYSPTASLVIDSTKVEAAALAELEAILFGTENDEPRLPLPAEVIALFEPGGEEGAEDVDLSDQDNQPSFVDATGVLTLPAVTGVQWKVNGANQAPGVKAPVAAGAAVTVTADATAGYNLVGDDEWTYRRDV